MKFKEIIKEMNITIDKIVIFEDILNSLLVFLGFYFVLLLLSINPMYSLIPAAMYLGISVYTTLNIDKAKIVESHYNELNEKLRTAEDSADIENPIVEELRADVVNELRDVKVSSFLNMKKTSYKIVAVVLLCFLIVFFASANITLIDAGLMADLFDFKFLADAGGNNGTAVIGGSGEGGEDIYGKEGIAELGSQEMELNIAPVSFEVGVRDISDFEERDFEETFPDEVFAESSAAFEENINLDEQELIKNYFKELSKG